MYEVKKNGIYLDENNALSIYKGNPFLEREILPSNGKAIYEFIQNFSPNNQEKNLLSKENSVVSLDTIKTFLKKEGILYEYETHPLVQEEFLRTKNFIDSYPSLNYASVSKKVSKVKLLILGLGTGGSYLLEILLKLGFRDFILIDGDKVEDGNLGAQNYVREEVGKYKSEVTSQKYTKKYPNSKITFFKEYLGSYEELKELVELAEVDYFINCADDFKLQVSILENIFLDYSKIKILYSGYSYLLHSVDMITVSNYQELLIRAKKQYATINISNIITNNPGSILNGFLSAFSISKLVLDSLLELSNVNAFVGNLYTNQYRFSCISKQPQSNSNVDEKYWEKLESPADLYAFPNKKMSITIDSVQSVFLNQRNEEKTDRYLWIADKRRGLNALDVISDTSIITIENIVADIIEFVNNFYSESFGEKLSEIFKRFNNKNSTRSLCTIDKEGKIVINIPNDKTIQTKVSLIHESFHAILYLLGDKDTYRHESFVFDNMLNFFGEKLNIPEYQEIITYFILEYTNSYLSMTISCDYEKGYIKRNFDSFKVKYSFLNNDIMELISVLNNLVSDYQPLYVYKYLYAIEMQFDKFKNFILEYEKYKLTERKLENA